MLFRLIYEENLAHGAYLIGCQKTGEAIVVDPARDVDRYIDEAARHDLRLIAATETHIHADFLSGTRELAERIGVRVYLSGEGGPDWTYGWADSIKDCRIVRDGDSFSVGNIDFKVVHTPGHTPEHVSFQVTDRGSGADVPMGLLTGDFVFVGDLGRPDLLETAAGMSGVKEEAARELWRSTGRLADFPDFLQVWPAHGAGSACGKALGAVPQSTMGYERSFNPALRLSRDESEFVDFVLTGQPEPPLYFGRMKVQNRDGVPLLGALPEPPAVDPDTLGGGAAERGPVPIDTRAWDAFRAGHVAGALFAPLNAAFHTVVGSYVTPEQETIVVADEEQVETVVRELVRIGLDRVVGFVTPERLVGSGRATKTIAELDVGALRQLLDAGEDVGVLDVRRAAELVEGSIASTSINIAHTRLPEQLDALPRERKLHVHCATGTRSAFAAAYLSRLGYDAVNVRGGMRAWCEAGYEVTQPAAPRAV